MLIDFCHHIVQSKVKADKVTFDGYEAHNLIERNAERKHRGFMSDHFVKPPVNVTIQLPCNVSIYRIVINPVIGQQKSCDIKLFTATERVNESWLYGNDKGNFSSDGIRFNCVGHIYQAEPVTVCFDNPLFKERHEWTVDNIPSGDSYPMSASMNARRFGGLSDVSHVTVCISRTKGAKSAAIKTLEIWGIPSVKVPLSIQQTLRNKYEKAIMAITSEGLTSKHVTNKQDCTTISELSDNSQQKETLFEQNGVIIPDDFIDAITCTLMTVPVLLPSGKNVDQSTLDRHINSEASWGRPPSDPFTGVQFSKGIFPVTNTSLKARIDQFVFQHSDLLKVPQTLGYRNRHTVNQSAGISSKLVTDTPNTNHQLLENKQNKHLHQSMCRKRKSSEYQTESKKQKTLKCGSLEINDKDSLSCSSTDHDTDLSRSLDSALYSTLSSLPSFTSTKKSDTTKETSMKQCSKCASDITMDNVIKYRLVCQHFICRECLVKHRHGTSLICAVCFNQCNSKDVVRVF